MKVSELPIFELYGLVLKKNKEAIAELYKRHKEKYPRHFVHYEETVDRKFDLKMMYLHLT